MDSPARTPILSASGIGRQADGRRLWRGLSFALESGACCGVVGPSGVGKTLLLRALARLDRLEEGDLALHGQAAADWRAPEYRARVLYVQQRPEFLEGTVEDNLRAVLALHVRRSAVYSQECAVEYLHALGRDSGLLGRHVEVLSGGERQSVALARALLCNPDVLLLDEPTASLDAALSARVEAVVTDWLAAAPGRAALWVSHDPAQIGRVAKSRIDLGASDA